MKILLMSALASLISTVAFAEKTPCTVNFISPTQASDVVERTMIENITQELSDIGCVISDNPNAKYSLSYNLNCIIWDQNQNAFERKFLMPLEQGIIGKDQNYHVYLKTPADSKEQEIGSVGWARGFTEKQYEHNSIHKVGNILERAVNRIYEAEQTDQ